VIGIPIGNWTLKAKVAERPKVAVPVVVMQGQIFQAVQHNAGKQQRNPRSASVEHYA